MFKGFSGNVTALVDVDAGKRAMNINCRCQLIITRDCGVSVALAIENLLSRQSALMYELIVVYDVVGELN